MALVVPVINYSWPSLPDYLTKEDYRKKLLQFALWISKHAPGLLYWWLTQIWFPSSSSIESSTEFFNNRDIDILKKTSGFPMLSQVITTQELKFLYQFSPDNTIMIMATGHVPSHRIRYESEASLNVFVVTSLSALAIGTLIQWS